jgi:hypothetical protein
MDVHAVVASAWQCNMLRFFAAALLAVVSVETRTASAAECGSHCDLDIQTNQYGDPRCRPREIVPKNSATPFPAFEGTGLRCDFRRRRLVRHHAPSVTPQRPSPAPLARQVPIPGAKVPGSGASDPGTGASDPGRQQPRAVDRDVGFVDTFGTRVDESHAAPRAPAGAGGVGAAGGAGAGGLGVGAGGLGVGAGGAARGRP